MNKITTFEEFEHAFGVEHLEKELVGLKNMQKYLAATGNPEKKLKYIVHIAGTNGKGSTAAALESILEAHNLHVGLHTSPHLVSYSERFRLNKETIPEDLLIKYLDTIHSIAQEKNLSLSLFEALTITAINYFVDAQVDIAIFETGLGGRLDATNILPSSLQIITDISIDHTEYLGNTIEEITFEKASIIKKRSTTITSNTGKALEIITAFSEITNQSLIDPSEFLISDIISTQEKTSFSLTYEDIKKTISTNLIGKHQAENTTLAYIAAQKITKETFNEENAKQGLANIVWPGRFQIISHAPLVILDGAHNKKGVDVLLKSLQSLNIHIDTIYFASKKNKDYQPILDTLQSLNTKMILVDVAHPFINTAVIAEENPNLEVLSLAEALSRISKNKNEQVLITGSLYFIGEFLKKSKSPFPFQQLSFLNR